MNTNMATYTYRIADLGAGLAATPTEVLNLAGVAGKKVYVTKITISGAATAAALLDIYLTKRTALNTGGTSALVVPTPHDSIDGANQAPLRLYSANPSALGAGTALQGEKIYLPAAATPAGPPTHFEYDFGTRGGKPLVLNSATESLGIGLNGQTLPAGLEMYWALEWCEQ